MVEIIKRGELPSEKIYTATCSKCQTIFRFRAGEAKRYTDQRDGDFYQIICPLPNCGKMVSIDVLVPVKRVLREIKDPLEGYGGHYGY